MGAWLTVPLVASCASTAAISSSASSPSRRANPAGLVAAAQPALGEAFAHLAKLNGDSNALPDSVVATTLASAETQLFSDTSAAKSSVSQESVFVLQGSGTFSGDGEKRPAGTNPVPGKVLTIVLRAGDLAVTDWGLTNARPNLASLGTVVRISK